MKLQLERPLVFFDLETTGVNIASDRIVELSFYKLYPNGSSESKTYRVRPVQMLLGQEVTMPIPAEASAVHGIYDADVADCPTFRQIAPEVAKVMEDSDLAGYNSNHFDIPLLAEEFLRAGVTIDLKDKKMIDAFTIFQKNEPRNLTAAYKFFCDKDLSQAHSANADTMATYEVLMAELERYDIPTTVAELSDYSQGGTRFADFAGRIAYDCEGVEIFNFGKYKGMRVKDVFRRDSGYFGWLINGEFPEYTKAVFKRVFNSLKG